ncbi:MAG: 3'(2'),5'-bisphosphate nucleotidase CysQ [Polyangiaceae bacterium]|jgi:3'(2'), 5'-bisphosphate nucleotidase
MSAQIQRAWTALSIAQEAAEIVLRVYANPFSVEYKAENDPVTSADQEANAFIVERLSRAFPGVPVVAEESDPSTYAAFAGADAAWFVDPLDGTREFVAKNGEFAVMIGLAERGRAVMGVIVAPAWKRSFFGVVGEGAWEVGEGGFPNPIRVSLRDAPRDAVVVVSRSHGSGRVASMLERLRTAAPVRHGSSGLKGVLVALGRCDAYVQPGLAGMRWDACATEALVRAAGGACTDCSGEPFDYGSGELTNKTGLLATNGRLHVALVNALGAGASG